VIRFDEASGAWMFICMHSPVLGLAAGGTRLRVYKSVEAGLEEHFG
jgi:hypothetical protein